MAILSFDEPGTGGGVATPEQTLIVETLPTLIPAGQQSVVLRLDPIAPNATIDYDGDAAYGIRQVLAEAPIREGQRRWIAKYGIAPVHLLATIDGESDGYVISGTNVLVTQVSVRSGNGFFWGDIAYHFPSPDVGVSEDVLDALTPRPSVIDERGSALSVSLATHLDQYVQVDADVTLPSVTASDVGRRVDLLFYGDSTLSGSGLSIAGDLVFADGEAGSCIVTGVDSWFVAGAAAREAAAPEPEADLVLAFTVTDSLTHRIDTTDSSGYTAEYPDGSIVTIASGAMHTQALPSGTSGVVTIRLDGSLPSAIDISAGTWSGAITARTSEQVDAVLNGFADDTSISTLDLSGSAVDRTAASDAAVALMTGRGVNLDYNGRPLYDLYADQPSWLVAAYDFGILSSLALSNGSVVQADDMSGNGRHGTQPIASRQPPFSASDARAGGLAAMGGQNAADDVYLMMPAGPTVKRSYLSAGYKNGTEATAGTYNTLIEDLPDTSSVPRFMTHVGTAALFSGGAYDASPRVNGATASTLLPLPLSSITATYPTGNSAGLVIGASSRTAGRGWPGPIRRFIATLGTETDAERDKVEGFMAWRDGTQADLATGHAYKTEPPLAS